jgi:hypothetical protein
MTSKIQAHADGRLAHHFWGEYCATIALSFADARLASLALRRLGDGWEIGKRPVALVWNGGRKELEACKLILGSFGADVDKIDSCDHSIDYGDPFSITVPVEDPNQIRLPL